MADRRNFSLRPRLPKTARNSKSVLPKSHYIYLSTYSVVPNYDYSLSEVMSSQFTFEYSIVVLFLLWFFTEPAKIFLKMVITNLTLQKISLHVLFSRNIFVITFFQRRIIFSQHFFHPVTSLNQVIYNFSHIFSQFFVRIIYLHFCSNLPFATL